MWRYVILAAVLVLAACSGGGDDVVTKLRMEGASMEPAFFNGDEVTVLRYKSPVQGGDLIAFHPPTSTDRTVVKRVIAVPGQTIEIRLQYGPSGKDLIGSQVQVDGTVLDEPYVEKITECNRQLGCIFSVPSENSPSVPNSRSSPVSMEAPLDNAVCQTTACYFVMGDNRINSADSRMGWLVPVDNIIGYVKPIR
jgi:signal peptidase I